MAKIEGFLSLILAQRPEDRPDIIARVFKIKLDQLLCDLKHGKHFGKVIAGIKYNYYWINYYCLIVVLNGLIYLIIVTFFFCV